MRILPSWHHHGDIVAIEKDLVKLGHPTSLWCVLTCKEEGERVGVGWGWGDGKGEGNEGVGRRTVRTYAARNATLDQDGSSHRH